jgi:chromosomal replication initiation ATPase DnaA
MTVDEELKKLYDLSDLINLRINFLTKNDIEFLNKNRSYFNKHIAEFIIDFISDAENVNKKLLTSSSRKQEIVTARMLCQYFIKMYTSFTLKQIGEIFGNRQYSTIIHAVKTVNNGLETNRNDFNNFNLYDERIRNYRNTVVAKAKLISAKSCEEVFSGEYIDSLMDYK